MKRMVNRLLAVLVAAGILMMPISAQAKSLAGELLSSETDASDEASSGAESSSLDGEEDTDSEESDNADASTSASTEAIEYVKPTTENPEEAKNGVVQINCVYVDENEESHIIVGSAGFIVGVPASEEDDEDGTDQYVITSKYIMNIDDEIYKDALLSYGVSKEDLKDNKEKKLSYEVAISKGMKVKAELVNSSDDVDIAVFKISENLSKRTCLTLSTSDDNSSNDLPYKQTDNIYAIGFPEGINYIDNPVYYYKDEKVLTTGKIVNIHQSNNIFVLNHDADITDKNCGGPLVDENGWVVGMNILAHEGDYSVAISSIEICDCLDELGISYVKMTPSVNPANAATSATSATTGSSITPPPIDPPAPIVPKWLIAALIVITVLLVALLALVVVLMLTKDKKDKPKPKKEKKPVKKQPQQPQIDRFGMPVNQMQSQPRTPNAPIQSNANSFVKGTETTSLNLPPVDNGTSVLGAPPAAAPQIMGTLIRRKNGENTVINKAPFIIGKDSLNIDFRIADNSAISRRHAAINKTAAGIVIEDYNSTNGTYVNGVRVSPEQPVSIKSGDVIKLADEEFDYRV